MQLYFVSIRRTHRVLILLLNEEIAPVVYVEEVVVIRQISDVCVLFLNKIAEFKLCFS